MQADTYIPRRLTINGRSASGMSTSPRPSCSAFFIGYLSSSKAAFAVCMAAGIAVSRWISRLKADKHPAFALHWLYWHLPTNPMTSMRATPPSHIRRMVG